VRCGNSAFCCPTNLPQCCVNAAIAGFSCAPSGFACCGQFGAACAPGSEQCCEGASDRFTPFEFASAYCAGAGQECCPWDFEDGACGADEKCCPPDLAVGGNQQPGCVPEDAVCCPYAGRIVVEQASQPTGAFCGPGEFCCPPIEGVVQGRCCPSFLNGEGGCCDPSDPAADCPDGFRCEEGLYIGFAVGCCVPNIMD
jgi:hypothetical protein